MNSNDVVELYKKGYSIEYIINKFYKERRKNIVNKNDLKKDDVRKDVENIVLNL